MVVKYREKNNPNRNLISFQQFSIFSNFASWDSDYRSNTFENLSNKNHKAVNRFKTISKPCTINHPSFRGSTPSAQRLKDMFRKKVSKKERIILFGVKMETPSPEYLICVYDPCQILKRQGKLFHKFKAAVEDCGQNWKYFASMLTPTCGFEFSI